MEVAIYLNNIDKSAKKRIKKKIIIATESKNHVVKTPLTHATLNSAKSGALIAMITSSIAVILAWWKGEININDAIKVLLHESVEGGVKSATTNVISTGTRHALFRSGAAHLARSHAPVAIATTFIMAATLIYKDIKKYRIGELSRRRVLLNAILHLTSSAVKTCVTILLGSLGAIAGANYGQIGTIIGATIGATVGYIGMGKLIKFMTTSVQKDKIINI
jgi:hypothetical protein